MSCSRLYPLSINTAKRFYHMKFKNTFTKGILCDKNTLIFSNNQIIHTVNVNVKVIVKRHLVQADSEKCTEYQVQLITCSVVNETDR